MSSKRAYAGNARFVEIGSPGVPFRFLVNLDTLEGMRFEEKLEVVKLPVPGTGIGDIPLEHTEEIQGVGWAVVLLIGGRMNNIDFPSIEPAMACYNAIMSMIEAVGVPMASGSKLLPPKPPSVILDADGKAREAVKAAVAGALDGGITDKQMDAIEAGEAGEDELPPDLDDEPMLTDEELEALTAPDAKNDG
jgi:hypothetical protein